MRTSDLHSLGVVPLSFRCIGIRLQPMTLGHLETLERLNLLAPSNPGDLAAAVFVCALPWNRFKSAVSSLLFPVMLFLWRNTVREWSFRDNLSAFYAYVRNEMTGPPVSPPHGSNASPGSSVVPLSRYLMVVLCSKLNHDPRHVRDYSVTDALWDHATLAEIDGRGTVEELPYDERVAEMEAMLHPDDVILEAVKGAQ